jgi:hypothetical protein
MCALLGSQAGAANVRDEHNWGPYKQCDMDKFQDWLKRARSNCYSCTTGANVCKETPTVLYHQYLNRLHPKLWEGTMLSLKAFLMTQVRRYQGIRSIIINFIVVITIQKWRRLPQTDLTAPGVDARLLICMVVRLKCSRAAEA